MIEVKLGHIVLIRKKRNHTPKARNSESDQTCRVAVTIGRASDEQAILSEQSNPTSLNADI
jgi:hypothetical protein